MFTSKRKRESFLLRILCVALFGAIGTPPQLRAQWSGPENGEFDAYRIRIEPFWFGVKPSGTLQGTTGQGFFDFQRDVQFNTYTSFTDKLD